MKENSISLSPPTLTFSHISKEKKGERHDVAPSSVYSSLPHQASLHIHLTNGIEAGGGGGGEPEGWRRERGGGGGGGHHSTSTKFFSLSCSVRYTLYAVRRRRGLPAPLPCNRMPCSPLKCIGGGRKGRHPTPNFFPSPLGGLSSKKGGEKKVGGEFGNTSVPTSPSLSQLVTFSFLPLQLPPPPLQQPASSYPREEGRNEKKERFFRPSLVVVVTQNRPPQKNPSLSLPCLVWGWWSRKTKKATSSKKTFLFFSTSFPVTFRLSNPAAKRRSQGERGS